MKRAWKSWLLALLAAVLFFGGVVELFNRQFASGEIYPEFSSLRTDRDGTRLLYDSLAKIDGVAVERNFLPMQFLPQDRIALVLLGTSPLKVNWDDDLILQTLAQIAARGNRVLLAMHVDPDDLPKQESFDRQETPPTRRPAGKSKPAKPPEAPLKVLWKVSLRIDSDPKHPHPLYFGQADAWRVREQAGDKLLAIDKDFGKGSIVLMAESDDFSNEAAVSLGRLRQVAEALGPYRRIVFDEHHLGIAESGSVIGMARRFRLMGFALGLAICTVLFIWKNAAGFPPPVAERAAARLSGRTSQAGLLTLLRRHIPSTDLAAVCWREWLSANRHRVAPERRQAAEAIVAGAARRPVEATREIQELLRAKGEA